MGMKKYANAKQSQSSPRSRVGESRGIYQLSNTKPIPTASSTPTGQPWFARLERNKQAKVSKFKQTEVGLIPEDWEVKALGEMVEKFINGGTPSTKQVEYWEGDIPWISGADILDQKIAQVRRFITKEAVQNSSTNVIERGDLLLVSRTGVGKLAIAPYDVAISQDFTGISVSPKKLSSKYLFRFLDFNQHILRSQNQGTSIKGITRETLSELVIWLPPTVEEQEAIAAVLGDVDELIDGLEQLLTKKRLIKQGAMQSLLTGKIRLPNFTDEWDNKPLGSIAQVVMGQSPSSIYYNQNENGLPLIQGNADISNRKTIKRIFTSQITRLGMKGDVIMSVRAPVGEISLTDFDVCLGRGVCAIRFPNNYLYHALISKESTWGKYSKGSTFDSVTSSDVKTFNIELPVCDKEQIEIANLLSAMDVEIKTIEARLSKTRLLKQGLMHELLTGRIRLR